MIPAISPSVGLSSASSSSTGQIKFGDVDFGMSWKRLAVFAALGALLFFWWQRRKKS